LINESKQVQPKGVQQPITIYDIWGMQGEYHLQLPRHEEIFLTLAEAIPIQYAIVDGKQTGTTFFQGSLLRLSPKGAEIIFENNKYQAKPAELTNVKLNLLLTDRPSLMGEDIYAKVLNMESKERSFHIHFTGKSPAIESHLNSLYETTKNNQ
jgi:adenylate cyclase